MTVIRVIDANVDAFLGDVQAELDRDPAGDAQLQADAAGIGLLHLSEALPAVAPPVSLRERILDGAHSEGRLARFAGAVAELLDVGLDKARALLDRIDDPAAWSHELPGISFLWVEGGPRVAVALRGFVRVDAGQEFPEHEHLGDEIVLVLQGGFEDVARGRVFRPGDIDRMPTGTSHGFRALPDGPDLLKLAVVQTGLRALGQDFLPR
jgi:quercetin dioxygenase-like cupin family protein